MCIKNFYGKGANYYNFKPLTGGQVSVLRGLACHEEGLTYRTPAGTVMPQRPN